MRSAQKCNAALGLLAAAVADYFLPFSRKAKGPSGSLSPLSPLPTFLPSLSLSQMSRCGSGGQLKPGLWYPGPNRKQ